ncbi:MAG: hypothetical protein WDN06_14730 [Asticcacaulis sp.]
MAAARARERMRALSRRAFEGEKRSRGLPILSMAALLLAGLLVYYDMTRINTPAPPASRPAAHAHKKIAAQMYREVLETPGAQ